MAVAKTPCTSLFSKKPVLTTLSICNILYVNMAIVSPAAGQNATAPQATGQLEEVIVTARMREESLQDVPLSITAFDGAALEVRDLRNLEDIAQGTAGMSYQSGMTSGYHAAPTIRGLSSGFLQDRIQNVGVFLDGIYLQRQSMMNMGLMEMERIEVVKGPQNSMYGHSAFAGAINYVTKRPPDEFSAHIATTQGTDDREDYIGAVGGPILGDTLLGWASFGSSAYDGASKNHHPYADANPSGFNNRGNLGGWDDETYNLSLTWNITDAVSLTGSWYSADLRRENQPFYIIGGLREVAATQTSRYDDMNFNEQSIYDPNSFQTTTGNTLWKGEFPFSPGKGECINGSAFYPCPAEDLRSAEPVVDPRSNGFETTNDIYTLKMQWALNEQFSLSYLYGNVDHKGQTAGVADRDPLAGSSMLDFSPFAGPYVNEINTNIPSYRPITELESSSHELRLDWAGTETLRASIGLYYGEVEDSAADLTIFAQVCSDRDRNFNGSTEDERAACNVSFPAGASDTPLNAAIYNPFAVFSREYWNGQPSNDTTFNDETIALFGSVDWDFSDSWTLRLEGRYTEDERKVERTTDIFGLEYGEQGCIYSPLSGDFCFDSTIKQPTDEDTFTNFTPRITVEWKPAEDSMVYASVAQGVKAGGFNNADNPEQLTYDQEENTTFEIGSKSLFFDRTLQLNTAIYFIDWTDMQGAEPPFGEGGNPLNGQALIGNVGDVESYGIEIEGSWYINDKFSLDFGMAYNNADFQSGTTYEAAQRNYYYQCDLDVIENGEYCGNTDVAGNQVPRNSQEQYILALNYQQELFDGWYLNGRIESNYQSKQYVTPLNLAYIPSRTMTNANLQLIGSAHWNFNLWVKNLTDEEYVAGVLVLSEQTKFMVSRGPERSVGLTVRYSL